MSESGRCFLTDSIMLSRNQDGSMPEKYIVKSVIGEGGSTVCYEAVRQLKDGSEETGKLKEFYPVDAVVGGKSWYYSLERLPGGQLVAGAGTVRKFEEMCREYLDTYKLLKNVMAENPNNEILKNYIQQGELLYGCAENLGETTDDIKPTVYIWSSGVAGKGFDKYIEDVRKNYFHKPEEHLMNILCVMIELTDCIKALHTAGLMHLDIKPSNFLLQYDSSFKIKSNNISLYDINSLCKVGSKYMTVCGTEGFCAPEVFKGKADNRSDIYSIGAMLFNAVVITKAIPDGLYKDVFYKSIEDFVSDSGLIKASDTNSNPNLKSKICGILKKCLAANPKMRYQSCTELKKDIVKAKERLEKIKNMPAKTSKEGINDPMIVIQKLLYEHPLYETLKNGSKELNVMLLGSGSNGQKFIDICLQAGQMCGIKLNIYAYSIEPEDDKKSYLDFRPEISRFVNIDNSFDKNEEAYANLKFSGVSQASREDDSRLGFNKNEQNNRELIKNLIASVGKEINYVFAALGDDSLSSATARICSEEMNGSCPVCYATYKKVRAKKEDLKNRLYPVWMNEPIDVEKINKGLGEMAFNTHISWNSNMNIDIKKERDAIFKGESLNDKYNRISSFAFVLSIKYKLYSLNINCNDPNEAADRFFNEVLNIRGKNPEAMQKFNTLVDLEHRRWVLEKVCGGWKSPRSEDGKLSFEGCIERGSVKDSVNHIHPCIVKGSAFSPLNSPEYTNEKWDKGAIDPKLDELDKMSIELHRFFKKKAEELKNDSYSKEADLQFIQNSISPEHENAVKAFKQFQFALKNILNGVESYSRQYDYYQDTFISALSELPNETKTKIEERLAVIKKLFFPVVESNLYRNYKANDEILVEKIPFILTYRYSPVLGLGFEYGLNQSGHNEAVFGNVAAATVLSPESICYFCCFDAESNSEMLTKKLDAVVNYFGKRKVQCGIKLILACLEEVSDAKREKLFSSLKKLENKHKEGEKNSWLKKSEFYDVTDYNEALEKFEAYLKTNPVDIFDGDNNVFLSNTKNLKFISNILELKIPYFEFNYRKKEFSGLENCNKLKYVKDSSFIRINDMFALMNAEDTRFNMPEFTEDYETLWRIYTGSYVVNSGDKFEVGVKTWNFLSAALYNYEEKQGLLAKFSVNKNCSNIETLVYFLPEYTYTTVKELVKELKAFHILKEESAFASYTSDTCRLELKVASCYKEQLMKIFECPHLLMPYYGVKVSNYKDYSKNEFVDVRYNEMKVSEADLTYIKSSPFFLDCEYKLLKQLQKHGFIRDLKPDPDNKRVSFIYSSPRIKKLLTTAGEILEIYAYYEVLKTGYFDDAASGYEFRWEQGDVNNELDLVLTKGFKSIFVECKAVQELKQDYYYKLNTITEQFGIGAIKVILGNTYSGKEVSKEINKTQKTRGDQLNIKTISEKDDIIRIGETLKRIMETE